MGRHAGFLKEALLSAIAFLILLILAFPSLVKAPLQREMEARKTIHSMSRSLEWYKMTMGSYPNSEGDLLAASPPYLDSGFCGLTLKGYAYACDFNKKGYKIKAKPRGFLFGGQALTATSIVLE